MLRAITTEMMYALIAIVLGAAVFSAVKFKMPTIFKGILIGAAVVVTAMMLSIDAKFWGGRHGRRGSDFASLAGQQPCQIDPLRPMAQVPVCSFVINFVFWSPGTQPPSPIGERFFRGRDTVLFWFLPADAL